MNSTGKQIAMWTLILTAMIIEIILGMNEKNLITQTGPVIEVVTCFIIIIKT
jgi:hypothetical protein